MEPAFLTDAKTPSMISRSQWKKASLSLRFRHLGTACQLMGSRAPPTFIRHKLASILSCSTILRACPILIVLFTGVSPFILEKRDSSERARGPCTISAEGPVAPLRLINHCKARSYTLIFYSPLIPNLPGLFHLPVPHLRKRRSGMRFSQTPTRPGLQTSNIWMTEGVTALKLSLFLALKTTTRKRPTVIRRAHNPHLPP